MSAQLPVHDTVAIRAAQTNDAHAIAALGDAAQRVYNELLPHFYHHVDPSYWHSRFLRSLGLRDYFIFVAEVQTPSGAVCAGYIELFIKHTTSPLIVPQLRLLVDNLVVAPGYRGEGIGKKLLVHADTFAREHGIDIIELQVATGNDAAFHLYNSHGFTTRSFTLEKRLK